MQYQCSSCLLFDIPINTNKRNPTKIIRQRKDQVAKKLIRKRIIQNNNDNEFDQYSKDGSNVIYRNNSNLQYKNCIFLDDQERVLAINEKGLVDIIRLPPYFVTTTTSVDDYDESSLKKMKKERPLGTPLYSNYPAARDIKNVYNGQYNLHSLRRGTSFALGLPNGELRLFNTERGSCNDNIGFFDKVGIETFNNSRNCLQSWIVRKPIRKYSPLFDFSLADQIKYPAEAITRFNNNLMMKDISTTDSLESTMIHSYCHYNRWDINESSNGVGSVVNNNVIQTAHIGDFNDNFCIRILDERTPRIQNDICVGTNSSNFSKLCFLNDNIIATVGNSSEKNNKNNNSNNPPPMIHLWDIRMLRCNTATKCCDQFFISYPRDQAHILKPECSYTLERDDDDGAITRMHALRNGLLVLSSNSNTHHVVDPLRKTLVKSISVDLQANKDYNLFAVDKQYGTLAVVNQNNTALDLYDLNRNETSRKRKKHSSSCNTIGQINSKFIDGYGLDTTLTSLSFNESGTGLVGTSVDGDIFLWRTS